MDPTARYEIAGEIARGEFTTLYLARDKELGRDVAIKQIHDEYLADPKQLERYWQEAQLLASLNHPYILSVYDVVRPRGWVILELMQGSIDQQLGGQPIDLDFLRVTLICALHALRILEENQIVHGDVKPSNLLLDRSHRVKLGDFGIARRLSGDDGSLVKGDTKYMAPEVVSDQFGPGGPHSDLYSLGFAAYELMCGANFETLFPGLDIYGGNRQMAWIMWHASLDRRLPEIHRVLQGVPADLAGVIERLVEKDPARRYRNAQEALNDLRSKGQTPGGQPPPVESDAAEETDEEPSKLKRYGAVVAVSLSLAMCLGMLAMPSGPSEPPVASSTENQPTEGILRHVDLKRNNIFLETPAGEALPGVPLDPVKDRILLDDKLVSLADLRQGDRITIERLTSGSGGMRLEILASRNIVESTGTLTNVSPGDGRITLASAEGETPITVDVPSNVKVHINGQPMLDGRPIQLRDVKPGEAAVVRHVPSEGRRRATHVGVFREVSLEAEIAGIDVDDRKISIRPVIDSSSLPRELPLADDCEIVINGQGGQSLADLRSGDRGSVRHDAQVRHISIDRRKQQQGIVQSVDAGNGRFRVALEDAGAGSVTFTLAKDAPVQLAGSGKAVPLSYLRPGDTVAVAHQSSDMNKPEAKAVTVRPTMDQRTWAILIGQQAYRDQRLPPLVTSAADVKAAQEALTVDHRVPEDQTLVQIDTPKSALEPAITNFLGRVPTQSRVYVVFAGHGFIASPKQPVLAAADFDVDRIEESGVSLRWLINEMESCAASEKVLVLNTAYGDAGALAEKQPSTARLVEAAKPRPTRPVSTSVTVIASCADDQKSLAGASDDSSAFGRHVAEALTGEADVDGDGRVAANELFAFVQPAVARATDGNQTPVQFLPDATPARLSDDAQQGVRRLLAYLQLRQLDVEQLKRDYEQFERLAPSQPDFKLATGLALLKHGKTSFAAPLFERTLAEHRADPLAHQALAWQSFSRKDYDDGADHVLKLLAALERQRPLSDAYVQHVYRWIGTLAEYLAQFAEEEGGKLAGRIESALAAHGNDAKKLFAEGRHDVQRTKRNIQDQFDLALTDNEKNQLRFKAKLLTTYSAFDFDAASAYLIAELDRF